MDHFSGSRHWSLHLDADVCCFGVSSPVAKAKVLHSSRGSTLNQSRACVRLKNPVNADMTRVIAPSASGQDLSGRCSGLTGRRGLTGRQDHPISGVVQRAMCPITATGSDPCDARQSVPANQRPPWGTRPRAVIGLGSRSDGLPARAGSRSRDLALAVQNRIRENRRENHTFAKTRNGGCPTVTPGHSLNRESAGQRA